MPISVYSRPASYQYRPVDLSPLIRLEEMDYQNQLALSERRRQEGLEAEANMSLQDTMLGKVRAVPGEKSKLQSIKQDYKNAIAKGLDKVSEREGSLSEMLPLVKRLNTQIASDIQSGDLYQINRKYEQGIENIKTLSEMVNDEAIRVGSPAYQRAMQQVYSGNPLTVSPEVNVVETLTELSDQIRGRDKQEMITNAYMHILSNDRLAQQVADDAAERGADEKELALEYARQAVDFKYREPSGGTGTKSGEGVDFGEGTPVQLGSINIKDIWGKTAADYGKAIDWLGIDDDLSGTFLEEQSVGKPADNDKALKQLREMDERFWTQSLRANRIEKPADRNNITSIVVQSRGDMEFVPLDKEYSKEDIEDMEQEDFKDNLEVLYTIPAEQNIFGVDAYMGKIEGKSPVMIIDNTVPTPRKRVAADIMRATLDSDYRLTGKSENINGKVNLKDYYGKYEKILKDQGYQQLVDFVNTSYTVTPRANFEEGSWDLQLKESGSDEYIPVGNFNYLTKQIDSILGFTQ